MRIIAGAFRGRKLKAPPGLTTRPTTDRVREAWFSMLGPLDGTVADVYAGTGALGFEALSRGAKRCVFVESDGAALKAIRSNAEALGVLDRVTLMASRVERAHAGLLREGPFDLILTDPPWTHIDDAERALQKLLGPELFAEEGRLVLGHPKTRKLTVRADSGLVELKSRNWGDSAATFFVFQPAPPSL